MVTCRMDSKQIATARAARARSLALNVIARAHAEAMVTHDVVYLRSLGASWSDIAETLHCSRQAASERYGWIVTTEYLAGYVLGACGGPCACPSPDSVAGKR